MCIPTFRPNNSILKLIFIVQFTLSSWAYLGNVFPATYVYIHTITFLFGALAISKPSSHSSVLMYLMTNIITLLNDIIIMSLYIPVWYRGVDNSLVRSIVDTGRFSIGMNIVDVILRLPICYVLFLLYIERGGDLKAEFTSLSGRRSDRSAGYDEIGSDVEQAAPHRRIDEPDQV